MIDKGVKIRFVNIHFLNKQLHYTKYLSAPPLRNGPCGECGVFKKHLQITQNVGIYIYNMSSIRNTSKDSLFTCHLEFAL